MASKTWICGCQVYKRAIFVGTNHSANATCGRSVFKMSNTFSLAANSVSLSARRLCSTPKNSVLNPIANSALLVQLKPNVRLISSNSAPMKSIQGWSTYSLGKKLLVLWGGAFTAIGLVVIGNYYFYVKRMSDKEDHERQEAVQSLSSASEYLSTRPCLRNTALLSILSAFGAWIVVFLFTSSPARAYRYMAVTPVIVGSSFLTYCRATTAKERAETEKINNVLRDMQKHKSGPPSKDL